MFLGIDEKPIDVTAMIDNEGRQVTYGELAKKMKEIGECVVPRSIIFMLCKNTVGSMEGYLGFIERDAVPLALNHHIDDELLHELIRVYKPAYFWVPEEKKEKFEYEEICTVDGYALLKTGSEIYPLNDKLQFLMTTSGSTGSPKLVRYKKGNLAANARNVAKAFGWTNKERPICDLGMQYTMGLNVINTHLYVGATVILTTYNLLSAEFWDYIKKERATNFTGVPFSYDIFYRLRFERMDLPDLTTLAEGGGRLSDDRFIQLAEYAKRTGKRFIASFGTTETAARIAMLPAELALEKTGSIGRAIPEGELFLIDENGKEIEEMEAEGEMCYRGPNVTMGYAECLEDLLKDDEFKGEYHTGDLAKRDKDGCFFVTGRLSRFLKLLSYRVSLDQSERLIQQKFDIECACAGTDKRMNVYLTDESKKGEVLDYIAEKTGLFKSLFKIIIVPEILRNDTGKVRYKEMDELYSA